MFFLLPPAYFIFALYYKNDAEWVQNGSQSSRHYIQHTRPGTAHEHMTSDGSGGLARGKSLENEERGGQPPGSMANWERSVKKLSQLQGKLLKNH